MNVEIMNVKVQYKNNKLLTFNDYVFKDKQITFITGRNGTGKTTLLKAIAGLLDYEGNIIGSGTYVAQEPIIFNKTVYENIIYPLKIRKLDVNDYIDNINSLSEKLDIKHLLNKNAIKLSGGERMKVSIIRSVIFSPKVLLLDEPTTHLDLESIEELVKLLKELKTDMNIIVVSHNKSFMDSICDNEFLVGE